MGQGENQPSTSEDSFENYYLQENYLEGSFMVAAANPSGFKDASSLKSEVRVSNYGGGGIEENEVISPSPPHTANNRAPKGMHDPNKSIKIKKNPRSASHASDSSCSMEKGSSGKDLQRPKKMSHPKPKADWKDEDSPLSTVDDEMCSPETATPTDLTESIKKVGWKATRKRIREPPPPPLPPTSAKLVTGFDEGYVQQSGTTEDCALGSKESTIDEADWEEEISIKKPKVGEQVAAGQDSSEGERAAAFHVKIKNPLAGESDNLKNSNNDELPNPKSSSEDAESINAIPTNNKASTSSSQAQVKRGDDDTKAALNNPKEYKCSICGRIFKSFRALGGHKSNHVIRIKRETAVYKHVPEFSEAHELHECNACDKSFRTQRALKMHQRSHSNAGSKDHRSQSPRKALDFDLNEPASVQDSDPTWAF